MIKTTVIIIAGFLGLCCYDVKKENQDLTHSKSNNTLFESDKIIPDSTCEIHDINDNLESVLFPFSFQNFNSNRILEYLSDDTVVDSISYDNEGYEYSIFTFKNKSSYLALFVKPESNWFYIDSCSIKGKFLKSKIQVGLKQNEFFKIIGLKNEGCSSIEFFLGETTAYYKFIFKDEKLMEVLTYTTE